MLAYLLRFRRYRVYKRCVVFPRIPYILRISQPLRITRLPWSRLHSTTSGSPIGCLINQRLWSSPRTPLGELTALPRPPSWWGGPQEPHPRLSPSGFELRPSPRSILLISFRRHCCRSSLPSLLFPPFLSPLIQQKVWGKGCRSPLTRLCGRHEVRPQPSRPRSRTWRPRPRTWPGRPRNWTYKAKDKVVLRPCLEYLHVVSTDK